MYGCSFMYGELRESQNVSISRWIYAACRARSFSRPSNCSVCSVLWHSESVRVLRSPPPSCASLDSGRAIRTVLRLNRRHGAHRRGEGGSRSGDTEFRGQECHFYALIAGVTSALGASSFLSPHLGETARCNGQPQRSSTVVEGGELESSTGQGLSWPGSRLPSSGREGRTKDDLEKADLLLALPGGTLAVTVHSPRLQVRSPSHAETPEPSSGD